MLIAAIRCDFCKKSHEIECRKAGQEPVVPDGWATIVPMINIRGTPKIHEFRGKMWNPKTKDYDLEPNTKETEKMEKKDAFSERRNKLRQKFDKTHVCEDCIEEVLTGKISLKLGHENTKN